MPASSTGVPPGRGLNHHGARLTRIAEFAFAFAKRGRESDGDHKAKSMKLGDGLFWKRPSGRKAVFGR